MSVRNESRVLFLNSKPLSLRILRTGRLSLSSICLMKLIISPGASDFSIKKKTQDLESFPCSHAAQRVSLSIFSSGSPRTRSSPISLLMYPKFRWESRRCHSQLISAGAFDSRHISGLP
ncbi:hypothetical protein LXL04_027747 [Taraxacum kok-saghyz]